MSHVSCHVSHVVCHLSCVTCHNFFLQSGGTFLVEALLSTGPISFSLIRSVNLFLQILKTPSLLDWAGQLLENITPTICQMSPFPCHKSHVMCHIQVFFFLIWFFQSMDGLLSKEPTSSCFLILLILQETIRCRSFVRYHLYSTTTFLVTFHFQLFSFNHLCVEVIHQFQRKVRTYFLLSSLGFNGPEENHR